MEIVFKNFEPSEKEKFEYVEYVLEKYPSAKKCVFTLNGEFVDIETHIEKIPFDRIRRITGYLVGTAKRWNDAKLDEESKRVKHLKGTDFNE